MMHPFFDKIKSKELREKCNSLDCTIFISDDLGDDNDREAFKETLKRWSREITNWEDISTDNKEETNE